MGKQNIPYHKPTTHNISAEMQTGEDPIKRDRMLSRITDTEKTGEMDEKTEKETESVHNPDIYNAEELTEIKNDVDQGWVHFCNASHNIYGQPVDRKHLLGRQDIRFGRQKSEN